MSRTIRAPTLDPDAFFKTLLVKNYPDLGSIMIQSIRLIENKDSTWAYEYSMDPHYFDWIRWAIPSHVLTRMLILRNTTTLISDGSASFIIESIDPRLRFRVAGRIILIDHTIVRIVVDTPTISYIGIRIPGFIQRLVVGNEAVSRILDTAEAEVRFSLMNHQ